MSQDLESQNHRIFQVGPLSPTPCFSQDYLKLNRMTMFELLELELGVVL